MLCYTHQAWFDVTDLLAEISEKQGRFEDAISLTSQGAKEAAG